MIVRFGASLSFVTLKEYADSTEKTPEPWYPQRPAHEDRSEVLSKHDHTNQGSQTPRAIEGSRMTIWDESELHFNTTV
jgi:hypothetical protein